MSALSQQVIKAVALHGPLTTRGMCIHVSGTLTEVAGTVLGLQARGLLEHADEVHIPRLWQVTEKGKQLGNE